MQTELRKITSFEHCAINDRTKGREQAGEEPGRTGTGGDQGGQRGTDDSNEKPAGSEVITRQSIKVVMTGRTDVRLPVLLLAGQMFSDSLP